MALVATTFAPGQDRSRAFAIYAAMTGIGSVAGLILGGVLTEVGWRLVFLINVPIGFAVAVGAWAFLKESQGARLRLDVPWCTPGDAGLHADRVRRQRRSGQRWASPLVIGTLIGGIAVLIAFVLIERNADHPILPFSIFDNSSRVAALIAILFASAIMMCMAVFISLYLQWILVYQPWQSGLAVVPFAFGFGIAAAIASNLSLHAAALAGHSRWGDHLPRLPLRQLDGQLRSRVLPEDLRARPGDRIRVGLAVVPLTLAVVAGVGATEIGPLTAVAQVAQQLGGAVGLVAVGAFATSRTLSMGGVAEPAKNITPGQIDALASGYGLAFAACGGLRSPLASSCCSCASPRKKSPRARRPPRKSTRAPVR